MACTGCWCACVRCDLARSIRRCCRRCMTSGLRSSRSMPTGLLVAGLPDRPSRAGGKGPSAGHCCPGDSQLLPLFCIVAGGGGHRRPWPGRHGDDPEPQLGSAGRRQAGRVRHQPVGVRLAAPGWRAVRLRLRHQCHRPGDIELHAREGKPIPDGWALDSEASRPTTPALRWPARCRPSVDTRDRPWQP